MSDVYRVDQTKILQQYICKILAIVRNITIKFIAQYQKLMAKSRYMTRENATKLSQIFSRDILMWATLYRWVGDWFILISSPRQCSIEAPSIIAFHPIATHYLCWLRQETLVVFIVRRYALHGLSYRNSVRPSVCLSVCLSVTLVHCVHTVKPTIMISSPYGSHIILVSGDINFIPKFEGDHPERGRWMRVGWVRIGDFRPISRRMSLTVSFMGILAGVRWRGGVKWEWGVKKCRFSLLSLAVSSELSYHLLYCTM